MKVLYILSSPRGGSTLLSYILGRNPAIENLGEVSFLPKLLALRECCSCGEPVEECGAWAKVFSQLEADCGVNPRADPYGFFIGDAIKRGGGGKIDTGYQTRWIMTRAKLRAGVERILLDWPAMRGAHRYIAPWSNRAACNTLSLYQAISEAWNADTLVDASKLGRKGLQLYQYDPQTVRLLHLVRDGRGVVASRKNVFSVTNTARQWRRYHDNTQRWLSEWVNPVHYRSLRYEDMVASPEKHLRELCDWLEICYNTEMTDFTNQHTTHAVGGNLPARSGFGSGIQPVDEKWKTSLTEEDLAVFRKIAGKTNAELGYV